MENIKHPILGHEFKNECNQLILCGRALTVPLKMQSKEGDVSNFGMLFEDGKSGVVLPLDLSSLDSYDSFIQPLDKLMLFGHIGNKQGEQTFVVEEIKNANRNPEVYNMGFVFGTLYDAKKFVKIDGQKFLKIVITAKDHFTGTEEKVTVYTQNEKQISYFTCNGIKRGTPIAAQYFLAYNAAEQSFSFLPILMSFDTFACSPNSVFHTYTPLPEQERFDPKAKFPKGGNYVTAVGTVKSLTEQIGENNYQAELLLKRGKTSFELPLLMNQKTAQVFDEHNNVGDTTIVFGSLGQNVFGFNSIKINGFTNLQKRFGDDYSSSFGRVIFELEDVPQPAPKGFCKHSTKAPSINKDKFKIKINGTTFSSKAGIDVAEQFMQARNMPHAPSGYKALYTFVPDEFEELGITQALPKIVATVPMPLSK